MHRVWNRRRGRSVAYSISRGGTSLRKDVDRDRISGRFGLGVEDRYRNHSRRYSRDSSCPPPTGRTDRTPLSRDELASENDRDERGSVGKTHAAQTDRIATPKTGDPGSESGVGEFHGSHDERPLGRFDGRVIDVGERQPLAYVDNRSPRRRYRYHGTYNRMPPRPRVRPCRFDCRSVGTLRGRSRRHTPGTETAMNTGPR